MLQHENTAQMSEQPSFYSVTQYKVTTLQLVPRIDL